MHMNSGLGRAWIVIQPIAMTAVLTFFLSFVSRVPKQVLSPALIVLSGLTIWTYFSVALGRSSGSLVANSYLLKKVYFPRLLFPLVPVFVGLVETSIMVVLLIVVSVLFGIEPTFRWLLIPLPIFLTLFLITGFGLLLSALNVRFRDISSVLPITLQLLMYLSPVIYLSDLVPAQYRDWFLLNPLCGPVNLLRWIVFSHGEFPAVSLASTILCSIFFIVVGVVVFRSLEDEFADII